MPENHIKALRRARGLSSEALAEMVGISQGHMSRVENGTRGLSIPLAEKIAMALETDVQSVIGLKDAQRPVEPRLYGLTEDAEPYVAGPDDILVVNPKRRVNVDPWRIRTNALDLAGIRAGEVVPVDISAEATENVPPLAAVIAQVYDPGDLTKAKTILRQFIPPSLLITNSSEHNEPPLNLDKDEVHIKGVVLKPTTTPR